jgi:hypothetical protein
MNTLRSTLVFFVSFGGPSCFDHLYRDHEGTKLTKEHEEDLFLFFVTFEGLRVFVVAFVLTQARQAP